MPYDLSMSINSSFIYNFALLLHLIQLHSHWPWLRGNQRLSLISRCILSYRIVLRGHNKYIGNIVEWINGIDNFIIFPLYVFKLMFCLYYIALYNDIRNTSLGETGKEEESHIVLSLIYSIEINVQNCSWSHMPMTV